MGTNHAKLLTKFDSNGEYDNFHGYAGDLTPPTVQPLSSYITIDGVFQVLKLKHPGKTRAQIMADDSIATKYFGPEVINTARSLTSQQATVSATDQLLDLLF